MGAREIPPNLTQRLDETPDARFYQVPRLVTHIDDATIAALTEVYRERIPPGARVLDLMSSWVSHLPQDVVYRRVAGLGMNATELDHNPQLTDRTVHDLNASPELPYDEASFDVVLNAVSVQYLTQPVRVFESVARALVPGGQYLVAVSHRLFPTKAIAAWQGLPPQERPRLVASYFDRSEAFEDVAIADRSPTGADPLWIISARRA